jgi:hypothetical protein
MGTGKPAIAELAEFTTSTVNPKFEGGKTFDKFVEPNMSYHGILAR